MKKTRLLEIIREEINEALNVLVTNKKGETTTMPFNTPDEKKNIDALKKDSNITNIETTAGQNIKEGEKRKKLAEKYQLDEDTINEMASVIQTKKALTKLGDEEGLELVKDVEKETLDQFKANPVMASGGRLARKLDPEEVTGKRDTRGYGADFERNFKKKAGMNFADFTMDIELKLKKQFPEEKFSSGLATNTTEKDAAAQIFGLEKGKQGRKADPNKPEKPASTGKKGNSTGTKKATLTPGDDGFDKVTYSDDSDEEVEDTYYKDEEEFSSTDTEGPSSKEIASDETAKELGSTPEEKKAKFNQFLASVKKNKEDKAKIDGILKLAKEKIKFPKAMMDDLKRAAGRSVE
jgi:hypothetical protein